MATSLGLDAGSGHFVPERVWSCPKHEKPVYHECDCEFCDWQEPACCQLSRWVDKLNDNGEVVMREVGRIEQMMVELMQRELLANSLLLKEIIRQDEGKR